jgi:hypothetical protein
MTDLLYLILIFSVLIIITLLVMYGVSTSDALLSFVKDSDICYERFMCVR